MPVLEDADEDVVDAGFGFGDVLEPETFFGARLDQCFHCCSLISCLYLDRLSPRGTSLTPQVLRCAQDDNHI